MTREVDDISIAKIKFLGDHHWKTIINEIDTRYSTELIVGEQQVALRGKGRLVSEAEARVLQLVDAEISETIPTVVPQEIMALVRVSEENEQLFASMGLIFIKDARDCLLVAREEAVEEARTFARE